MPSGEKVSKGSQSEGGVYRLLGLPRVYSIFRSLVLRPGSFDRFVRQRVRPFPGCSILDIGCGPGDTLSHLPESIGEYVGFDSNTRYIDAARRRWGTRGRFFSETVSRATDIPKASFDIVISIGVLHHLEDLEAGLLMEIAKRVLKPGGRLVTYDNVTIDRQSPIARLMNRLDRGNVVRTEEGYVALARTSFRQVRSTLLHDTLRFPYTVVVMECTEVSEAAP